VSAAGKGCGCSAPDRCVCVCHRPDDAPVVMVHVRAGEFQGPVYMPEAGR
jgi:hypothetical protein